MPQQVQVSHTCNPPTVICSAGTLSKIVRRKDIPTQELNKPGVYRGRASKRDIFVLTLMPALHKCSFPRFLGNSVWNVESVLPCFTSARYRNSNYPLQHIGNLFRGALGFQSAGMQQAGSQCGDSLCTGQRTCGRESSFEILHAARILKPDYIGLPTWGNGSWLSIASVRLMWVRLRGHFFME